MPEKQEILLMNKGFMVSVVNALKTLDVRGYESNKKLVGIVDDLERAIFTTLPLDLVPNKEPTTEESNGAAAERK